MLLLSGSKTHSHNDEVWHKSGVKKKPLEFSSVVLQHPDIFLYPFNHSFSVLIHPVSKWINSSEEITSGGDALVAIDFHVPRDLIKYQYIC